MASNDDPNTPTQGQGLKPLFEQVNNLFSEIRNGVYRDADTTQPLVTTAEFRALDLEAMRKLEAMLAFTTTKELEPKHDAICLVIQDSNGFPFFARANTNNKTWGSFQLVGGEWSVPMKATTWRYFIYGLDTPPVDMVSELKL